MLDNLIAVLLFIQKTVVQKKIIFIRLLQISEITLVVFALLVASVVIADPRGSSWLLSQIGPTLGTFAMILFAVTLIPGILQRSRLFPKVFAPISSSIILLRRHLGILMFLAAWIHMAFTTTIPSYLSTGSPIPAGLRAFEFAGFVGWIVLLPVWLTSNDVSMRFLGRKWKLLQRLTYVSMWFIFMHVALQGEGSAVFIGALAALELWSWIIVRRKQ